MTLEKPLLCNSLNVNVNPQQNAMQSSDKSDAAARIDAPVFH